jgi:hypothetical protein
LPNSSRQEHAHSALAGLGPAIHETPTRPLRLLVDARPKAGHERVKVSAAWYEAIARLKLRESIKCDVINAAGGLK